MPEYLAPGVYVEEVSYRAKSIEGVSTTTTGFVGPTRYGPIDLEPDILTSLVEFERVHGGAARLVWNGAEIDNYMWNAVRAFFEEGGKRCYIARTFDYGYLAADDDAARATKRAAASARVTAPYPPANVSIRARFPGRAGAGAVVLRMFLSQNRFSVSAGRARLGSSFDRDVVAVTGLATAADDGPYLLTRDEKKDLWTFDNGKAGAAHVAFELQDVAAQAGLSVRTLTATVLVDPDDAGLPFFAAANLALDARHAVAGQPDSLFAYFADEQPSLSRARSVPIVIAQMSVAEANAASALATADSNDKKTKATTATAKATQTKNDATTAKTAFDTAEAAATAAAADAAANTGDAGKQAAAAAARADADTKKADFDTKQGLSDAAAAAKDAAIAARDSAKTVAENATAAATAAASGPLDGLEFANLFLVSALVDQRFTLKTLAGKNEDGTPRDPDAPVLDAAYFLTGGSDGAMPGPFSYEGEEDPATNRSTGLRAFEGIEDISIVAGPGHTARTSVDEARAIAGMLIGHAERMRYRIAVLDSMPRHSIAEVRDYRGKLDSSHAALYYPWVKIIDPVTNLENHYPPSGFVAGIYARNDVERAVYKAPANEVVRLAIGFEKLLNKGQQEVLNPEGINCFRYFEGRGMRLWGARTISSDPEWKYVNLRRYFAYLERSIDKGTQWAVFEPNGDRLWANVRRTIEDFLLNEWQNGALLGDKPEKSYFVKCDRSTMTQNDLDNGRLVCQVGVAALRPAEFVIFRIGQWTADRKA
ncbi:MAG: phage tail sheath subtilisin-like domain-containing protein [Novosphingobium sp.]